MNVTIFGAGYVGLVHAAVLAETGHHVTCMDVDVRRVERLRRGDIPIFEPGLTPLVVDNQAAGRLVFTSDAAAAARHGEIQFIAVGTPPDEDGSADLSYVLQVAETIASHLERDSTLIVVKSTVPVGTSEKVSRVLWEGLAARGAEIRFQVASNPEFLKEGSAVADSMKPDRIVIGCDDVEAEALLRELYAPFNRNHEKIILMDVRSAELTKYAANCMLATKITLMNEIAILADMLGADIENVRQGIGSDPRIGYNFIYSGIGYGGSCFPKDVRALIRTADETGFQARVLEAVEARNLLQKQVLIEKIRRRFGSDLSGRTFAIWGLAFKPNTDDMREAPVRVLMEGLLASGASIQAYDPVAMAECRRLYGHEAGLSLTETKEAALSGADALVICTEWKSFLAPDFSLICASLKEPVIFDGRNIYDPKVVARHGLELYGIGRRSVDTRQPRETRPERLSSAERSRA